MLINLFGIYFHPFEIPLLAFLSGAVALEFLYRGDTIQTNRISRVTWLFAFLALYICAIILSALNAMEVSLVFKSAAKWVEVGLIVVLLFLYVSNVKRFQVIYWILFVSTFVMILWVYLMILTGKVSFLAYRVFPGSEAVFAIALLMPFIKSKRKWIYLAFLLSLVSCLLSLSRLAWLALTTFLIYYYYSRRSFRSVLKVLLLVFLILGLVSYFGRDLLMYRSLELFSGANVSNVERTALIHVALTALANHPLIGVGSLNFSRYMVKEGLTEGIVSPNLDTLGPHNAFLQVAAEEGLIGLLFFSLTLFLALQLALKAFKQSEVDRPYLIGLCGFFIVMLYNLAFGFISAQFRFFLAVMIGLATATSRIPLISHKVE